MYALNITSDLKRLSPRKLKYLEVLSTLRKKIKEFQPDILHAHYASSYGFLGALTGFHPFIISAWGSDVYDFPNISFLHRSILKYNLSKADYLLSTSNILAQEIKKYTAKLVEIIPFGVDLKLFRKIAVESQNDEFIVGTVKTLAAIYRIDILIKSFKLVADNNPHVNIKLLIIGDGPDRNKLQILVQQLGIENYVQFNGNIENSLLPDYYNKFSVFVSLSDYESFGVVAVEAMACECPVIVSDADGFSEVVENNKTGFIVPKRDAIATQLAIQKFLDDDSLRQNMGKKGRERVMRLYDWDMNIGQMLDFYNKAVSEK